MRLSITRYSQAEQRPSSGAPTALWTLTLLKSVCMPQKVGFTGKVHSHQNHGHVGPSTLREYRKEGQGPSLDLLRYADYSTSRVPAAHTLPAVMRISAEDVTAHTLNLNATVQRVVVPGHLPHREEKNVPVTPNSALPLA